MSLFSFWVLFAVVAVDVVDDGDYPHAAWFRSIQRTYSTAVVACLLRHTAVRYSYVVTKPLLLTFVIWGGFRSYTRPSQSSNTDTELVPHKRLWNTVYVWCVLLRLAIPPPSGRRASG